MAINPLLHHISVTWHFRRCKLFFFWIPSVRRTICCHFHENQCYFIFSTLYNLNIYLWPLKPHNFKSMCRISKIITFLESLRQAGWFDLFESDIQALLIFDPHITLWGNFDALYLKLFNDASVASACFYVRTCRRVRNSKKIATIRDFHLPGSFHLFVNSTTVICLLNVFCQSRGRGYSHVKAYGNVPSKWVTFSPKIVRHESHFGKKKILRRRVPFHKICKQIVKSAVLR